MDLSGLTTFEPIAVQTIAELIKKAVFNEANLSEELTIVSDIKYRKKIGLLTDRSMIGAKPGATPCVLNEIADGITASEKEWTPEPWDTRRSYCYKSFVGTVGEVGMKTGAEKFDIQNTPVMDKIVEFLAPTIIEMYNRYIWMCDKDAAHTDDSPAGNISPAIDLKYVNMQDSLWKQAFAIATAAPTQRITIAANSQSTEALQKSALTPTLALSYANSLYFDAPLVIQQALQSGKYYYKCTTSFFNKLIQNFQGVGSNAYVESMIKRLESGIRFITINGIEFRDDPTQDAMIKKFNDDGTKLFLPHRVIMCSKDNMYFGMPDASKWGEFDIFYDRTAKKVYIDMADEFDVKFIQDNLVMMAY